MRLQKQSLHLQQIILHSRLQESTECGTFLIVSLTAPEKGISKNQKPCNVYALIDLAVVVLLLDGKRDILIVSTRPEHQIEHRRFMFV